MPVAWTAADGGTIEALAPRTDSLGQAWARWTLGRRAGPQRARVQVGNPRTMPPFTVTVAALAGPAAAVAIESGADQEGTVGAALAAPDRGAAHRSRRQRRRGSDAARRRRRAGACRRRVLVADARGRVSLRWTLGRQAGPQRLELRPGEGDAASA